MLGQRAAEIYTSENNRNCAEAMMHAANEMYQLRLSPDTLRSMAGFGGGMTIEETCGALTGGVAVLGIVLLKNEHRDSDYLKERIQTLFSQYEAMMGSINCKALKDQYREEDPVKCRLVVEEAGDLLEALLEKEGLKAFNTSDGQ